MTITTNWSDDSPTITDWATDTTETEITIYNAATIDYNDAQTFYNGYDFESIITKTDWTSE
jgi:hypothetical protein